MNNSLLTSYETGKVLTGADAVIQRFKIAAIMGLGEFSPSPSSRHWITRLYR